jgi:ATP-dependent helicase/nuclease subunit A
MAASLLMTKQRTMNKNNSNIQSLTSQQTEAVEPGDQIWLSASAGTGKTQVLSARVIRLLLDRNTKPESLLCLTFTKAGAAEMAGRINARLASWVQMDKGRLAAELMAIGADHGSESISRARMLFADILDAPGGGLRIMTIHSFCQSLLGSFPQEAGLLPGFQSLEGRDEAVLKRQALADMVVASRAAGQGWLLENLQTMSLDMGEKAAQKFLENCAKCPDVMRLIPDGPGAQIFARRFLDIQHTGSIEELLKNALADTAINRVAIEQIAVMNAAWGTKTGVERALAIRAWLSGTLEERAQGFEDLHLCWATKTGSPRAISKSTAPQDSAYPEIAQSLYEWTRDLTEQVAVLKYADRLAAAFLAGKAYSFHYQEAKDARGVLDFDDLIRNAAKMLNQPEMTAWIRYKLDQRIDHILIDEAQDTNQSQWDIVRSLADDFFSGSGAKSDRTRTIFAVGDYKQAIFGFQGTDPQTYKDAGDDYETSIAQSGGYLNRVELSQSFRSSQIILDFVNAVVEGVGYQALGLSGPVEAHVSEKPDVGCVTLLSLVERNNDPDGGDDNDDASEESWLSSEKRRLAYRIAQYVRRLLDEKPVLATTGKPARAGDIMILLRRRTDLASSIVAQLHSVNVPVAGIDRMKIREPIAVQDLLSVIKFALQPDDDLNLAALLVSPLFGWSQEKLLEFGYREKGIRLWRHLRNQSALETDIAPLRGILAQSDYVGVYQFLENILSGEIAGRSKLTGRLGSEALVPIEELLNKALEFEKSEGGTLQAFLRWFEQGETEIKREGETSGNVVRVMTVHGAKGLQAPVVILADIASDPTKKPDRSVQTNKPFGAPMPLLPINRSLRIGRLDEIVAEQEASEQAEHLRLLYVAITRAEERLILVGSMNGKEAPEKSWYPSLRAAMEELQCQSQSDNDWGPGGYRMQIMGVAGLTGALTKDEASKSTEEQPEPQTLPDWLYTPAPQEDMPPRPLTPTRIDDDQYGEIPASSLLRVAAVRGKLIHSLFERLSGDDPDKALHQAEKWLQRNNSLPELNNQVILRDIERVITNAQYRDFFGPMARAEVPIAAVVGTQVVSGRIDRLLVGDDLIRVIDFKTGRRIPKSAEDVPVPLLRQMAHYVAALEVIFGNHRIEAALLFTSGPELIALPDDLLNSYKPK